MGGFLILVWGEILHSQPSPRQAGLRSPPEIGSLFQAKLCAQGQLGQLGYVEFNTPSTFLDEPALAKLAQHSNHSLHGASYEISELLAAEVAGRIGTVSGNVSV